MSRFANPNATERMTLGPCECPGSPHPEDWMDLRVDLGAEDLAQMERGGVEALEVLVVRWNLLDNDGSDAAVDREHLSRLYIDLFPQVNKWTKAHVRATTKVPKASAAPSPTTSGDGGSPTPTAAMAGSSTT